MVCICVAPPHWSGQHQNNSVYLCSTTTLACWSRHLPGELHTHHLLGLLVKISAWRTTHPPPWPAGPAWRTTHPPPWPAGQEPHTWGLIPAYTWTFSELSHFSDKNLTLLATLSGAWRYRVSAGTGWPSVSIL